MVSLSQLSRRCRAGDCLVDEVLVGADGGNQGGDGDVADGSGLAAGGLVDLDDGVVGEQASMMASATPGWAHRRVSAAARDYATVVLTRRALVPELKKLQQLPSLQLKEYLYVGMLRKVPISGGGFGLRRPLQGRRIC
jgi:hypothetical protein